MSGRAPPAELLPLAYKELALSGVLDLTATPGGRFRRPRSFLALRATGSAPFPESADLLASLRRHAPEGGSVDGVVHRVAARDPGVAKRMTKTAVDDLARRGAVAVTRRSVLGIRISRRLVVTAVGEELRAQAWRRITEPAETPLPAALLLLVEPQRRHALDRALQRSSDDGGWAVDWSAVDSLDCFDTACSDAGGPGGHAGSDGGGGD